MADVENPRERIYDEQISPLMDRILSTCKEHGIPVVFRFELDPVDGNRDDPLFCTSAIVPADAHPSMLELADLVQPKRAVALAMMTTTKPDGSKLTTIRRIS